MTEFPLITRNYVPGSIDPATATSGDLRSKPMPAGTDMKSLIIETADALGMSPGTLATIISYETGGTFNPMKAGPTTQWGQHRGLIQFGEPQAAEYGADFSSPEAALRSQLGADGAVVRYFRKNGWQPGMSELDAYSIVNAGAPGRYNASDANNGGAPGTVADKVKGQFGPHREKAAALLGGEYVPTDIEAGGAGRTDRNPARLAWAYANGKMTPEDAALYEKGMAEGAFPKADKPQDKPQRPSFADVYAATAFKPRTPFQPVQLAFDPVKNATPWEAPSYGR